MKRFLACALIAVNICVMSCSKDEIDPVINEEVEASLTITQEILQLVNIHRESIGKPALKRSSTADRIADEHTHYMIAQSKISHDNFTARFGKLQQEVNAKSAGENVAYGYANGKTVMDGWLNSPGHKANIEGDYTHIGISAIKNADGRYYYTQLFYR